MGTRGLTVAAYAGGLSLSGIPRGRGGVPGKTLRIPFGKIFVGTLGKMNGEFTTLGPSRILLLKVFPASPTLPASLRPIFRKKSVNLENIGKYHLFKATGLLVLGVFS